MKKVVLVVPVYNEEKILEDSINKLYNYFKKNIKYNWKIVIANNASNDRTEKIANSLSKKFKNVRVKHIKIKGRGYALRTTWTNFDADAYGYCDVDLATDIYHTKELFDSIIKEGYDIVTGNRYMKSSDSIRTKNRFVYSKIYIYLVKILFNTKLTDFQCGFKAVNKKTLKELFPEIKDNEFFFDTELILRAEKLGYKIKQIPVKWNEMRVKESKVNIIDTGLKYTKQIFGLKWELSKKR